MKVSQNLYAETFVKTLGAAAGERAAPSQARRWWRRSSRAGASRPRRTSSPTGRGSSRYNYVTPEMLVTILQQMYRDPRHRDAFVATLPVGGEDGGTIAKRFKGTRAEGNVRAKTGSIANVRALSGYVTSLDGEPIVFSIIANNFTVPQATIDADIDRAVEQLGEPHATVNGSGRSIPFMSLEHPASASSPCSSAAPAA